MSDDLPPAIRPKILDHKDHPSYLEVASYGGHDDHGRRYIDSITVECTKAGCGEVVTTLWERGAENDE